MTRNIVKVSFFKAGKYNSYRLADGMKIFEPESCMTFFFVPFSLY